MLVLNQVGVPKRLLVMDLQEPQDPDNPGVLVLSRFAGAAAEMDGALIVNSYDAEGMAEAMQQALHMAHGAEEGRTQALGLIGLQIEHVGHLDLA